MARNGGGDERWARVNGSTYRGTRAARATCREALAAASGLVGPRQTCRANQLWPHLYRRGVVVASRKTSVTSGTTSRVAGRSVRKYARRSLRQPLCEVHSCCDKQGVRTEHHRKELDHVVDLFEVLERSGERGAVPRASLTRPREGLRCRGPASPPPLSKARRWRSRRQDPILSRP